MSDSVPSSSLPPEPDGLEPRRRWRASFTMLAAIALVVLDAAIANVALPSIARDLAVTPGESVLVVTAYQTALVMFLLPAAALGESRGYRGVFTTGVALFVAASGLCALAPSLPWLVVARFLQGIGGAAIMSLGVALLRFIHPRSRLGAAIGWNAMAIALSAAAGPAIGAAILSIAAWPWLFAVNLPVGAIVLLTAPSLPAVPGSARRLDRASVALTLASLALFIIGADLLASRVWLAAGLLASAMIGLLALFQRERHREAPLIPIDLMRDSSFRQSVIASVLTFSGQMASLVALPFHLHHALGQSVLMTGLYMTPWPLAVALAAPLSGRALARASTATLCAIGGGCLAAGLALAAVWPASDGPFAIVPFTILCGFGFGFFQTPNNRNLLMAAPRARTAAAAGVQGMARLSGQTIGSVLMTLLFALLAEDRAPRVGLAISAVLALTGAAVSLRRSEAVASAPASPA